MLTHWLFTAFVVLLALQRLSELRRSARNEQVILSRGGREFAGGHFRWMRALHAAWLPAMLAEALALNRPFIPWLAFFAGLLFIAGQILRYSAMQALGWRWTVRVMVVPGLPPVQGGIYRYIRHPNYLGVILEVLAAPLLHSAFLTAAVFSVLNGLILFVRIRAEEQALRMASQSDADSYRLPRFFPRLTRSRPSSS